VSDTKASIM